MVIGHLRQLKNHKLIGLKFSLSYLFGIKKDHILTHRYIYSWIPVTLVVGVIHYKIWI